MQEDLTSEKMIIEALQDKNSNLKGKNETQKKLFGAKPGQAASADVASSSNAELVVSLQRAQQQLDRALEENKELKAFQKGQSAGTGNIDASLKDVLAKRDQFEEELTVFKNQDRVIREKCTHLEMQN